MSSISMAIGAPIRAAKGQLIKVDKATVNIANSYFLIIQAAVESKHIYLKIY